LHGIGLALNIIENVKKSLEGHRVKEVKELEVELGEFYYVSEKELKDAFEIVAKDTIMGNVALKVSIIRGRIRCINCGYTGRGEINNEPHAIQVTCPKCGEGLVEILEGKELKLKKIRVEIED